MSSSSFGLIELLLVFGLVIGWAVWQWWSVKKDLRDSARKERDEGGGSK